MKYKRIAQIRTPEQFEDYLETLGIKLAFDTDLQHGPEAFLSQTFQLHDFKIGNRFSILPMEGWDATTDGRPTDLTARRWRRFGESGAKLIWGGQVRSISPIDIKTGALIQGARFLISI